MTRYKGTWQFGGGIEANVQRWVESQESPRRQPPRTHHMKLGPSRNREKWYPATNGSETECATP
jgi:hypothetical protein